MIDINNFNAVAVVPIVVALVQAVKMIGSERVNRFAPFIALGFGVLISFLFNTAQPLGQIILAGVLYGLSASGLYSSTKYTAHNMKGEI